MNGLCFTLLKKVPYLLTVLLQKRCFLKNILLMPLFKVTGIYKYIKNNIAQRKTFPVLI